MEPKFIPEKETALEYCFPYGELPPVSQQTALRNYNDYYAANFQWELNDLIEEVGLEKTYATMSDCGLPEDLDILGEIIVNDGERLGPYTSMVTADFTGSLREFIPDEVDRALAVRKISAAILKDYKDLQNYLVNEQAKKELLDPDLSCVPRFDLDGNLVPIENTGFIIVYQLPESENTHDGAFIGYDKLLKLEHRHPKRSDYQPAFLANIIMPKDADFKSLCEKAYIDSQQGKLPGQTGHRSLSVSDVIQINGEGPASRCRYFFCDSVGFREVNDRFFDPHAKVPEQATAR